jgi:hypothetical protein
MRRKWVALETAATVGHGAVPLGRSGPRGKKKRRFSSLLLRTALFIPNAPILALRDACKRGAEPFRGSISLTPLLNNSRPTHNLNRGKRPTRLL